MVDQSADDRQFVFVLGMPRSGTSWVQGILDGHPECVCRLEDRASELLWSFRTLLTRYNRTLRLISMQNDNRPVRQYETDDLHVLLRGFYPQTARSHMTADDGGGMISRVGFRDKTMHSCFGLFAALFPRARYIYVIRDPRDMVISSWNHYRRLEEGFEERAGNLQHYARSFIREWIRAHNAVFYHPLAEKVEILTVRYEDLAADPDPVIKHVFDFIDLSANRKLRSRIAADSGFSARTGGRNPGEVDDNAYLRQGLAGAWQQDLSPKTLAIISAVAGRYMRHHGYDPGIGTPPAAAEPGPPEAIAGRFRRLTKQPSDRGSRRPEAAAGGKASRPFSPGEEPPAARSRLQDMARASRRGSEAAGQSSSR